MERKREIVDSYPQLESIEDETLRSQVIDVWVDAIEESKYNTLGEIEWMPGQAPGELLVTHVNDVTDVALALFEQLTSRNEVSVDRDAICAGALLHDVSKLPEQSNDALNELLPHPHYVVHQLATAGIDEHVMHIALSHTERTNVPPMTHEAHIVHHADYLAAQTMYRSANGSLPAESVLVPSTDS